MEHCSDSPSREGFAAPLTSAIGAPSVKIFQSCAYLSRFSADGGCVDVGGRGVGGGWVAVITIGAEVMTIICVGAEFPPAHPTTKHDSRIMRRIILRDLSNTITCLVMNRIQPADVTLSITVLLCPF